MCWRRRVASSTGSIPRAYPRLINGLSSALHGFDGS
jgi:hypothetical protein